LAKAKEEDVKAPDIEFRQFIARQAAEMQTEDDVDKVLSMVEEQALAEATQDDPDQKADDALAVIDAWASLASYVVWRFYSPRSPREDEAGMSEKAAKKLRNISKAFRGKLYQIMAEIGASGFSISVGLTWGVSVGLTW
jgi:hypothetical protein